MKLLIDVAKKGISNGCLSIMKQQVYILNIVNIYVFTLFGFRTAYCDIFLFLVGLI